MEFAANGLFKVVDICVEQVRDFFETFDAHLFAWREIDVEKKKRLNIPIFKKIFI